MTFDPFAYRARLDRVVDGDTFDVTVDLGFHITRTVRLRLKGVDTAEIYGVDKESDEYGDGMRHKKAAQDWFDAAEKTHDGSWYLIVSTSKTGKYGRYIADVRAASGDAKPLSDALIDQYPSVRSE